MRESESGVTRVATPIPGRKNDRLRAKTNIRKAGIRAFCKHENGPSYFSEHWREYKDVPTIDLRRKSK